MISGRQIISRSVGPIFAIFTSNESFLSVDDRSGPFLRYLKGRCHGNRFCAKNSKLPTFVALAFRNRMGYRYLNGRANSANDACISCENFVKFGPATPELTGLIWERLVWHIQKIGLFGLISLDLLDRFSQSLHYTVSQKKRQWCSTL